MGNCLETGGRGQQQEQEEQREQQQQQEAERSEKRDVFAKDGGGGLTVKIVLTKEELEWLMFQLQEKKGKSLEGLLQDLEKCRRRTDAWKPSLESVMEIPEVHEMDS